MAAAYHLPVTAAQVGACFVGQYYHVLQQQPQLVHQFYSDASTMLRVDRTTRETATAMLQIHSLVMSLNFTGIEIKTAHSLESWSGGVLVMVTGSVQMKDLRDIRKFVQTFFLAPQEKGFFVLNDIFQFIDEEPIHQHPAAFLAQGTFSSNLNASATAPEPAVPTYVLAGEMQAREYVPLTDVEETCLVQENGHVEKYSLPERPLTRGSEAEHLFENTCGGEANGLNQNGVNDVHDLLQTPIDESCGEPQKQTYASIAAKGRSSPAHQPVFNKSTPPVSGWHEVPQLNTQQQSGCHQPVVSSVANGGSGVEVAEEAIVADDEAEIKSVYVRNLPSTVSASEIEDEFKNFGNLKPGGVAIRNRKDVGACYAFVEFEDATGVHNAIKAYSVQIAGRPAYIEERRASSSLPPQGGRRGRGGGNYQNEGPRGRYGGRNFRRGGSRDGGEWDFNRPKGIGLYRSSSRPDRGFVQNPTLSNRQNLSESSS